MALSQATFISPSMQWGMGNGTVDITENLSVSWKVNGSGALVAYQIQIYTNDSSSTLVYNTGKVTLDAPFYGTDGSGNVTFFSASLSAAALATAGMTNGEEYKLSITQWWGSGASDYITQSSAAAFITRANPTVIMSIPATITTRSYTFTATYTQAQGDALNWVRWQIADYGSEDTPFYDTQNIYGTAVLQTTYDGFFNGNNYVVRCMVQTMNGEEATTGWVPFTVAYSTSDYVGDVNVKYICCDGAVRISWAGLSDDEDITGYSIYRLESTATTLWHLLDVDATTNAICDYTTHSGGAYTYYIFPYSASSYALSPLVSEQISPIWWNWSIFACEQRADGTYKVNAKYDFGKNLSSGAISNNNVPSIQKNFTRYPSIQKAPQNYQSGTLQSLIGVVTIDENGAPAYSDTIKMRNAIWALSTTTDTLFLKNRKGDLLRVAIAGATSMSTMDDTREQAQTVSLPWVEIGDASDAVIVAEIEYFDYDTFSVENTSLIAEDASGVADCTIPQQTTDDYTSLEIVDNAAVFTNATVIFDTLFLINGNKGDNE